MGTKYLLLFQLQTRLELDTFRAIGHIVKSMASPLFNGLRSRMYTYVGGERALVRLQVSLAINIYISTYKQGAN